MDTNILTKILTKQNNKNRITIRLDEQTLATVKVKCLKLGIDTSKYLKALIEQDLKDETSVQS